MKKNKKINNKRNFKPSSFICLKCGKINDYGIDRNKRMREFLHVKDLYCCHCHETTKQVEVRYCDYKEEIISYLPELNCEFYKNEKVVS